MGMQNMGTYGVQMNGMLQMGNQVMGNQMMGNQMMGNQMQQQGMNAGNWWGMTSEEDKEAYLKWCEERMWQSQLKQTEEYDASMSKYTEMKVKYMFSLTM